MKSAFIIYIGNQMNDVRKLLNDTQFNLSFIPTNQYISYNLQPLMQF